MAPAGPLAGPSIDPAIFKPLLRAYSLGYLSSTGPRLLSILISKASSNKKRRDVLPAIYRTLLGALAPNRFPTFCGTLVGGSTLLQPLFQQIILQVSNALKQTGLKTSGRDRRVLARFLAAWLSAWVGIKLLHTRPESPKRAEVVLNGKATSSYVKAVEPVRPDFPESYGVRAEIIPPLAGRTMDLTLYAVTRALDVVVGELWSRRKTKRVAAGKWTRLESLIGHTTDAGVFALSSSVVMWAWFYLPYRLPRTYNKWIREAAQVDDRLIEALRRVRYGDFIYGKETGQAPLLQSMCKDYGWPIEWGDPVKTIPIPCNMVHMGTGHSCEWHALSRFFRAFKFALATYLPLNLIMRARSPSRKTFIQALKDASRSSAFLGAFISLFYYSVCLSRTRLGPRLINKKTITPMMWDGGLCVGAGCMMCGWSILLEVERRRQEVAFFVAPRAAATVLPRRYDQKYQWRETLAFAVSTAIVFTCVQENKQRVRGVLGRILGSVLNEA